jgi:hypothetical protein
MSSVNITDIKQEIQDIIGNIKATIDTGRTNQYEMNFSITSNKQDEVYKKLNEAEFEILFLSKSSSNIMLCINPTTTQAYKKTKQIRTRRKPLAWNGPKV